MYMAGVLFVVFFGASIGGPDWVLLAAAFLAGFCISGGQKSVIALAAIYYPTPIRSTGVGWALGIGRLGGIAGPLLLGALLTFGLSPQYVLYATAVPMLLAGVLVALLGRWYGSGARRDSE
jgi:AAHS family 4-hydroxybenzoate transporter-like MFS transporter